MTANVIPDDVTTAAKPKAKKLGLGNAFASDYGNGMDERTYIATACLQGLMTDPEFISASDEAARVAVNFADALLLELAK